MTNILGLPNLGLGLGLRSQHFNYILEKNPKVEWFEIISENFMDSGGRPRHILRQMAERYPLVMHGVSMSIGSSDPLDFEYLKKLKALGKEINPVWISDHLCWTGILGINSHDLLPVPLNEETLQHICKRIVIVQDFLERPLILENPSTYLAFQQSSMPEHEFLAEMTAMTNCGLLLDVNNVYVSAFNNNFDPVEYIKGIPADRVVQMHLAGHEHCGDFIVDTHDREVTQEVWKLYSLAWQRTGGTTTLLEWDGNIPDFETCFNELQKAKKYWSSNVPTEIEIPTTSSKSSVSNPVDFMVSPVFSTKE